MTLCDPHGDFVCHHNDSVPSQSPCMTFTMTVCPVQWRQALTMTLHGLKMTLCAFTTTLCPQTMTLCAFLKESVCFSQWLLCAIMTLSIPHNDLQGLWVGCTVALCNNLCALIVNLCLLRKPQCSFHNDFACPPKDSIWPSHCMPSQCLCTFTMTWVPWQWLHVTFTMTLCDLQKE